MKNKDRTLVNKTCKYCGKDFVVEKFRRGLFCNRSCANNYRYKDQKTPNAICSNCGDRFYMKQSQLKNVKTPCCSMRCSANIKKTIYTGSKNPNYKGKQHDHDGYRLYVPQASTINFGRMKLHTAVCCEIFGVKNIKMKKFHIHHRDCDVENNTPGNLAILSVSDHKWIHKQFGNATLWAFMHNKIDLESLCEWSDDKERAKRILPLSISNQSINDLGIIDNETLIDRSSK